MRSIRLSTVCIALNKNFIILLYFYDIIIAFYVHVHVHVGCSFPSHAPGTSRHEQPFHSHCYCWHESVSIISIRNNTLWQAFGCSNNRYEARCVCEVNKVVASLQHVTQ